MNTIANILSVELNAWRDGNPRAVKFLQSLDHLAAVARPAISIGLFFTGLHFAGDLAGQAAVHAAEPNGRPSRHRSGHHRRHCRRRRSDREHHQRRRQPGRRPHVPQAPIPLRPTARPLAGRLARTRTPGRPARRTPPRRGSAAKAAFREVQEVLAIERMT